MAYRLFSTTRRARSSMRTLEEFAHQTARETDPMPHSYTKTSRTQDILFSKRRIRTRDMIRPLAADYNTRQYGYGHGVKQFDVIGSGRLLATAAAAKGNSVNSSLAFVDPDGKDDVPSNCDIETQFKELKGARAKRIQDGEYSDEHPVETIAISSVDDLNTYYTFPDGQNHVGSGTYGTVMLGVDKRTGEKVAIKAQDKSTQPRYRREVEMLKRVNFKGCVRLLRVFESPSQVFLVTEYLAGGDLFDYIVDHNVYLGNLTTEQALRLTRAMLCSLEACHLNDFAHLDVKPENFVFRTSPEADLCDLVMIDFGAAQPFRLRSFARGRQDYVGGMDDYWIGEPETHIGGTASYVSPEVVIQGRFSSRSDMWSMGVTLYMMLTGQRPFDAEVDEGSDHDEICYETEIQKKIKAEAARARNKSVFRTCEDLQGIHEGTKRLLVEMTQPDPAMRPSTTEAIHYIDKLLLENKF